MDPSLYKQIFEYKVNGKYSSGISKANRNEIRRKASKYDVEGERHFLHYSRKVVRVYSVGYSLLIDS